MSKLILKDFLKKSGLDFTIAKHPLIATDENGGKLITPYYGLFNSKTKECINTCKAGYTVSQNKDVIEMVLKGMTKFGDNLEVVKAGSLHGGRRVYAQLEITGNALSKVGKNDLIKRYVTVIDSNDGSTGLSVGIGDETMSCENQFFRFYKAGDAKFRHTATIEQKILTIPMLIETALDKSLEQIKIYNRFASTDVSKALAHKAVNSVLGYDRTMSANDLGDLSTRSINMMDSLYSHIEKEMKQKGQNLWGLHSGVTSFTTHETKGPKRDGVNDVFESILVGSAYKKNQASFDFAMEQLVLA